jgi:septum formation protein
MKNYNFILASKSPRRKQLLEQAKYNFIVKEPKVKENNCSKTNAYNKAYYVAKKYPDTIVLACDTIVICNSIVLNKPKNTNDAFKMLKMLNNTFHYVHSSFCILKYSKDYNKLIFKTQKTVITKVYFASFSDSFYKAYIKTKEPMDKAGAYGIQEIGSILIKKIKGSYTNVVGLPMYEVSYALQKINITALI